jgi:MarR family multiple antibiotic resistance transcriptional regulator
VSRSTDLFDDLIRFETRLYNSLSERMRQEHGLTMSQFEILRIIERRTNCRVFDIAREVAITVGATSKAIDRIEDAGWCRRSPNPEDRRSSLLSLTPAGKRLLAAATPTFEAEMTTRVEGVLSASAVKGLGAALAMARRAIEADGAGQPRG